MKILALLLLFATSTFGQVLPASRSITTPSGRNPYPEYWISADAGPSGTGTFADPYCLTNVLKAHVTVAPGDTYWMKSGTYSNNYTTTTIHGSATARVTLRAAPGARVTFDGSINIWDQAGYVDFWGLEICGTDTNRVSAQSSSPPSDIPTKDGVYCYVPHVRYINCIIHDRPGDGFYFGHDANGCEVYGCIVYNNGYMIQGANASHGHGIYVTQTNTATFLIQDNVSFNNFAACYHLYSEDPNWPMQHITMDGNVAFNPGAYTDVDSHVPVIIGMDGTSSLADSIQVVNNHSYYKPGSPAGILGQVQIGRQGTNGWLTIVSNRFSAGLQTKNWTAANVLSNWFGATGNMVDMWQNLTNKAGNNWDYNLYQSYNSYATPFVLRDGITKTVSFTDWKTNGWDANSTLSNGDYTGTLVVIRLNKYEANRANVIVYNWDSASTVSVDMSTVLKYGQYYDVHNVQDYYGTPVATGVYTGGSVSLPMTGCTPATAVGPFSTPPEIGPVFECFVVIGHS